MIGRNSHVQTCDIMPGTQSVSIWEGHTVQWEEHNLDTTSNVALALKSSVPLDKVPAY